MKKLLLFILLCAAVASYAQNKSFGVGTAAPNSNAALHVESPTNNQGFIMPRLTTQQRTGMGSLLTIADNGLMLYDTDAKTIFIWDGTMWKNTAQVAGGNRLSYPYKDSVTTTVTGNDIFALKYNNAAGKRVLRVESLNPANGSSAVSVLQNGTGLGIFSSVNNPTSGTTAIYGTTNSNLGFFGSGLTPVGVYGESTGTGSVAGSFRINNATNTFPALYSETNGTGSAARINAINANSTAPALEVINAGAGNAIQTTGKIQAGQFIGDGSQLTNITSSNPRLTLPYKDSILTAPAGSNLLKLFYGGTTVGNVGLAYFENLNPNNAFAPLFVRTFGTGSASNFFVTNTASAGAAVSANTNGTGPAVNAATAGTGNAGSFRINNAANTNSVITANTNGTGDGVFSQLNNATSTNTAIKGRSTNAGGGAGAFEIFNATNPRAAVYAVTQGTGGAGSFNINNASSGAAALSGSTNGTGAAIQGTTSTGFASVYGRREGATNGNAGQFEITDAGNAFQALAVRTIGTGSAATFDVNNASSGAAALFSQTNGTGAAIQAQTSTGFAAVYGRREGATNGSAGQFDITNVGNGGVALHAGTLGTGSAGSFNINNATSAAIALNVSTNGTGAAINASNTGTGNGFAGYFSNSNATNGNPALQATTNGTGAAIQGQTSTGFASVYGRREGATNGSAGQFDITNAGNGGAALQAGTVGTGSAAGFQINNSSSSANGIYSITNSSGAAIFSEITNNGYASIDAKSSGSSGIGILTNIENSANSSPSLSATTKGTGSAGSFNINNATNTNSVITANTNGTGDGVFSQLDNASSTNTAIKGRSTNVGGGGGAFEIFNSANSRAAVFGFTQGVGPAGGFHISNTASTTNTLDLKTNGTGAVIYANHTGVSGNIAIFQSASTSVARIDKTGKGFFDGGTQNSGADVAEMFDVEGSKSQYEPGDVLVISETNDRTVEKSSAPASTKVVGVYATKPGVVLTDKNIEESLDELVPMGVIGVIPTKVCLENGPIKRGDLLVTSSKQGHAMKSIPVNVGGVLIYPTGAILGKALENFDSQENGLIKVLVNVK